MVRLSKVAGMASFSFWFKELRRQGKPGSHILPGFTGSRSRGLCTPCKTHRDGLLRWKRDPELASRFVKKNKNFHVFGVCMGSLSSPELSGWDDCGQLSNPYKEREPDWYLPRGGQDKVESPSKHFPPVMGGEPTKFYPGEGKESGRQSY